MYWTARLLQIAAPGRVLSNVARGTAFEERSLRLLRTNLSMVLARVGGRSDGGVDLVGWWWLPLSTPSASPSSSPSSSSATPPSPSSPSSEDADGSKGNPSFDKPEEGREVEVEQQRRRRRIRVIAQCKAETKKLGPNYVREMEGVLFRHMHDRTLFAATAANVIDDPFSLTSPSSPSSLLVPEGGPQEKRPAPMAAVLVSESAFTKESLLRAQSSPVPFMLIHLPPLRVPKSTAASSEMSPSSSSLSAVSAPPLPSSNASIGSAFWNPALGGTQGLLGGEMEVRWERAPGAQGVGRPALWTKAGERVGNWVPDGVES